MGEIIIRYQNIIAITLLPIKDILNGYILYTSTLNFIIIPLFMAFLSILDINIVAKEGVGDFMSFCKFYRVVVIRGRELLLLGTLELSYVFVVLHTFYCE